jgi:hypothetical protein
MRFYLGTHEPSWLGRTEVPLFISRRRLAGRRSLPRARGAWALDSGGFSELALHGRWVTTPAEYVAEVRRYASEIGSMRWAAIQDWMCEPVMLSKTGLSVAEHQARTLRSYLELRELAPQIPWAPVVQGWTWGDYLDHIDAYAKAGVDLRALPTVGLGSVCRRQNTMRASLLLLELQRMGLDNLHGFGFKVGGLVSLAEAAQTLYTPLALASADSLAWSYQARREPPRPECKHASCANCLAFALDWRERLIARLDEVEAYVA